LRYAAFSPAAALLSRPEVLLSATPSLQQQQQQQQESTSAGTQQRSAFEFQGCHCRCVDGTELVCASTGDALCVVVVVGGGGYHFQTDKWKTDRLWSAMLHFHQQHHCCCALTCCCPQHRPCSRKDQCRHST
jgi:hypothetical protein